MSVISGECLLTFAAGSESSISSASAGAAGSEWSAASGGRFTGCGGGDGGDDGGDGAGDEGEVGKFHKCEKSRISTKIQKFHARNRIPSRFWVVFVSILREFFRFCEIFPTFVNFSPRLWKFHKSGKKFTKVGTSVKIFTFCEKFPRVQKGCKKRQT